MVPCGEDCDEGIGGGALRVNGDDPGFLEVANLGGKLGGLLGLVTDGDIFGTVVMVGVPVVGVAEESGDEVAVLDVES